VKEDKEVETKVRRKRETVEGKKKSIKFKKPDFKLPEFLELTKKQISYLVICILVITAIVCFVNYDKLGLVLNKNITDEDVVQVDLITSNNKVYSYNNEVLVANSDGIATYNKYGKQTWELELKGAVDDYIDTSGNYLQVINHDKSLVYVYKDKYEKARIKVDGEILSGRINEKGYSVIEYTTTGSKTILGVYDNKGNLEYNVKLSNNIIGEYVLSNNLKYIAYVDVNIKGISVSTNVVLVELKNNNVKTIYSSEASLVYDLKFNGNNLLYKLDDQVVYHNLSNDKKVTSTLENESIVNIDVDDKKYAYTEFNNGKYFLGIRSIGGKETKEIEIREMPKHFIYENGNIFICYQKGIVIYNGLKMLLKEYDSSMIITKPIVFGNGRNIAFLVSNKLVIFGI